MVPASDIIRAVLLTTGLTALVACGAAEPTGQRVASLPDSPIAASPADGGTASAGGDPTAKSSDDTDPSESARPQRRLDDSPEREAALWHTYDQCLLDNGAQPNKGRQAAASGAGDGEVISILEPVPTRATQACQRLLPLLPPELDPALNPAYHDDFVAWVNCMRKRGMPVHVSQDTGDPTAISWTYDSENSAVPKDADTITDECQLQAFGGGR